MARKPTWTPDMIRETKPAKGAKVAPTLVPKRGRPKKTEGTPNQGMVYLDSDFYLVRSPEGYQEALRDWWGDDLPSSVAKSPDEFPAIVCFSDSSEPGPKIRCSWAPRSNLGITGTSTRDVDPQIVEKIVEVAGTTVTVEKIVEVEKDLTISDIFSFILDRIVGLTRIVFDR